VLKFVVPPVVGACLATVVMVGLVWSQNHTPSVNPASESALTYGAR